MVFIMPSNLISLKSLFKLSTRLEKRFYILWNRIQERRQLILFIFLLLFYIVFFLFNDKGMFFWGQTWWKKNVIRN